MKYSDFLKEERPCPFCDSKRADIITSNKSAYLTYTLAPYHKDHLLVVPKRHIEHLLDVTEEELKDIDNMEKKAWAVLKKLGYESVSFIVREGKGSGRTVNHIHYHVIPEVRLGDVDHNGDTRRILTPKEIEAQIHRIKSAL